ncbi:hypothetical protein BD626DRAFT_636059 [Schizophyllum amplum]|uniref:F-box domain-containing protein n=1 Tax=Schizophyllum amplum TaxID=97359 RepID=A0A550BU83_9AGAR|nr:hypothetical protein BD626DRAFT_636059 [Auriculariopsis ampla]
MPGDLPPALPQELIDAILDTLAAYGEEECLRQCALAHRSMLQRSQQLLFATIELEVPHFILSSNAPATPSRKLLIVLRHSPHLGNYVHELSIVEVSGPISQEQVVKHGIAREVALLDILPMLRAVKWLRITAPPRSYVGDDFIDALAMPSLLHLSLYTVTFPLYILDRFPHLRHLTCHEVHWIPATHEPRDTSAIPKVKTLTVSGKLALQFDIFLGLLAMYPPYLDNLIALDVSELLVPNFYIEQLLDRCQSSLQQLHTRYRITQPATNDIPNFAALPSLRDLAIRDITLRNDHKRGAWSWLLATLQSLRPLRRLVLMFLLDSTETITRDAAEWRRLDEILDSADIRIERVDIHANELDWMEEGTVVDAAAIAVALPCARRRMGQKLTVSTNRLPTDGVSDIIPHI